MLYATVYCINIVRIHFCFYIIFYYSSTLTGHTGHMAVVWSDPVSFPFSHETVSRTSGLPSLVSSCWYRRGLMSLHWLIRKWLNPQKDSHQGEPQPLPSSRMHQIMMLFFPLKQRWKHSGRRLVSQMYLLGLQITCSLQLWGIFREENCQLGSVPVNIRWVSLHDS